MKQRLTKRRVTILSKNYSNIQDPIEAERQLSNVLKEYSPITRKAFYEQMETLGMNSREALNFIEATERYNEQQAQEYSKERQQIDEKWNKIKESWSRAEMALYVDDKGGLSQQGETMYRRFIENNVPDYVALQDKSIILSDTVLNRMSKEKILSTRLKMGTEGYLNDRMDTYISNYRSAFLKRMPTQQANSMKYWFDRLSRNEKINVIKNAGKGAIQEFYLTSADTANATYISFLETIADIAPKLHDRITRKVNKMTTKSTKRK